MQILGVMIQRSGAVKAYEMPMGLRFSGSLKQRAPEVARLIEIMLEG